MSTTPTEISDQHNKIKVEKTKAAASLSQCSSPIIKYTASFLDDDAFTKFCQAAQGLTYTPCKDDLKKRKIANRVKKGLLPHVSIYIIEKGRPDPIHQFCNSPDFEIDMILTKTPFSEGHYSRKLQEFVYTRRYRSISALQLATVSGDKPLLLDLLACILKKEHGDKYRVAALQQLEEVHRRITNQKICLDAVTAIKEIEFGENDIVRGNAEIRLKEIQESEIFQKQMKEFINEMDELRRQITDKTAKIQKTGASSLSHPALELKSETERKVTAENAPIKYADGAEALEPVLNLIKAYIYYYLQYDELVRQDNLARVDQLWEYIGERQKRLPHYHKQVFFLKPFSVDSLPTLITSPKRMHCQYWDKDAVDFDGLGIDTTFGLYKGLLGHVCRGGNGGLGVFHAIYSDMTVFAHLYKLFTTGIGNIGYIIEQLKDPETANSYFSKVNGGKPKF